MSALLIVVLAILGVLLLVALAGAAGATRRNRVQETGMAESLTAVDRQLAAALAADRGWERDGLEAAVRSEFAKHRPGVEVTALELLQVVDEPGTDGDLAVFRVDADGARSRVTLGRREGAWYGATVEDER